MLEYFLFCLAGVFLGVFTGLTPGLHVNTVCLLGVTLYRGLGLDELEFALAMCCMSATHTFLDYIPAIFIGVPEESTALSVLPAHRLVMAGAALDAVRITAYGSLMGLVYSLLLLAPMLYIMPIVYNLIRDFLGYAIVVACVTLAFMEKGISRQIAALAIFLLSGFLGLTVFNIKAISGSQALFPVFSGLFGLSGIMHSLGMRQASIPQRPYGRYKPGRETLYCGFMGAVGGMIVGFLPAMSPSQVGILLSGFYGSTTTGFLTAVSATNTADAIYSLVSLHTIGNGRSGVSEMLSDIMEFNIDILGFLTAGICFSCLFAYTIHLYIGKIAIRHYNRIGYKKLSIFALFVVLFLVYALTGYLGLAIVALSTFVGLTPIYSGVSRTHLMGVLIIPTITYIV